MRHPPFNGGPAQTQADYCTKAGAERLAEMIVAAWAKCGISIEVRVVQTSPNNVKPEHSIYAVQMPTIINGLYRGQ